jgi:hypothetical protein
MSVALSCRRFELGFRSELVFSFAAPGVYSINLPNVGTLVLAVIF